MLIRGAGFWSGFPVLSVDSEGTIDLLRGSGFASDFDSKLATMSFWINMQALAANRRVFAYPGSNVIQVSNTGVIASQIQNTSAVTAVDINSGASVLSVGTWAHVMIAINTTSPAVAYIYLNGSDVTSITTLTTDAVLNFTTHEIGVLANSAGNLTPDCFFAEFWFDIGTFINPATDIGRFRAGGRPVNLGASGEGPTGALPTLYLSARTAASDFVTNRGYGGAFTETGGTFTAGSSSPSD